MNNLNIRDEISLLYYGALLCKESKTGHDGAWQIAPLFCSLPYRTCSVDELLALKERLATHFPELVSFGDRRAAKAYHSRFHSITKPSYIQRLRTCRNGENSQIDNLVRIAAREPASGGLVFSVFSPIDLETRLRPGYVPCLVSGSFLVHDGEFQMNAFFRSQSIIEFGIQDLIFLRTFQAEMLEKCCRPGETVKIALGSLNIHFARIIIQRRLMRYKRVYVRRETVIDSWLKIVEGFIQERYSADRC